MKYYSPYVYIRIDGIDMIYTFVTYLVLFFQ